MYKIDFNKKDFNNLNIFLNRIYPDGENESIALARIVEKIKTVEPLKLVKKLKNENMNI